MSIFKKLFGKENEEASSAPVNAATTEQDLLEQFGGIGLDKQRNLYAVIGDNAWNADMNAGTISFGADLVFPIQVLGTFSHSSETWLWGWANEKSGIAPALLQQALQLKKHGEQHEINLLKNSNFDAAINDLHIIGMIASGMFGASAYYLADYGQGILLATVKSDKIEKENRNDHVRISTVFPELISLFEMNHKAAFTHYVTQKGYTLHESSDQLTATRDNNSITAAFDEQSRLIKLSA